MAFDNIDLTVNVKPSVQNILLDEGINGKITLIRYILSLFFLSFSSQITHLKYVDKYTFWGGSEKVYVWYTHLNVGNYGRSLRQTCEANI